MGTADGAAGQMLAAMQLSDSMFPAGLFAASNGLESMFLGGEVAGARGLEELNRTLIERQAGPLDCAFVSGAHAAAAARDEGGIARLDAACAAARCARESREAAARSGAQLARCVAGMAGGEGAVLEWYRGSIDSGAAAGMYPVSLGVCAEALGLAEEPAIIVLLYGSVASSVGAALRLGMIDHLEGQEIIHRLKPLVLKTAAESLGRGAEWAWQFAPQAEIAQMRHEREGGGMFAT